MTSISLPSLCPHCGEKIVKPSGPKKAPLLVMGEFPGQDEITQGMPFVGRSGYVLRDELGRVGLDLNLMRCTNLWLHRMPLKTHPDYEDCWNWTLAQAVRECKNRTAILLLGSECAKTFIQHNVMDICGLKVGSNIIDAPLIVCSPNPAIVFREPVGEVRRALQNFSLWSDEVIDEQDS